jgi:hypothetical protein
MLGGPPWLQLAIGQRINPAKFLARLDELRNMISRVLNCFLRVHDVNDKVPSLPPDLIVHIRKAAHDLF